MQRDEILTAIADSRADLGVDRLTFAAFTKASGISMRAVLKHFDSWSDACAAAGVQCGPQLENLVPNSAASPDECVSELRRVAGSLGRDYVSQDEFDSLSRFNSKTPIRKFGSWKAALAAAGLRLSPYAYDEVPFESLAEDFLSAALELQCVPSLAQVSRRSDYGEYLFSTKHGGYPAFKTKAVACLLDLGRDLPEWLSAIPVPSDPLPQTPVRAHEHGRTLGFRAFSHEPTYEQEVVGLFASVAEELGFDITCMREEFPDCEARRRTNRPRQRYKRCLIEFELRSSDYRRHGHPLDGCDLVVCWIDDWNECPLEVLELKESIRQLSGWR